MIFPDPTTAGGVVYRKQDGTATPKTEVENAYAPAPAFHATCDLTGLPSDCTARVEPRQVNAIVSELVSLAECLNPTGAWNCESLQNLCAAFAHWASLFTAVLISDTPPVNPPLNMLWWESDTGLLFLWYDDGNSKQWVQVAGDTMIVDQVSIIGNGTAANPYNVAVLDCGTY
jgi:hypothetical protein